MTSTQENVVAFGRIFSTSPSFTKLHDDIMALCDEMAEYLDKTGKIESSRLPLNVQMKYVSESMRATTRIMNIAQYVLLRQSINNGDLTEAEAQLPPYRVDLKFVGKPIDQIKHYKEFPTKMQELIMQSFRLYERVCHFEKTIKQ